MWIFTTFGFFSVVQKPGSSVLTVRARDRTDLDSLRARYLPSLSETVVGGGTDYPYRATVAHEDLAPAMSKIVADIDYSNFKSEVARKMGSGRASVYAKVWQALLDLEP